MWWFDTVSGVDCHKGDNMNIIKEVLVLVGCGAVAVWLAMLAFGIVIGVPYGVYLLIRAIL